MASDARDALQLEKAPPTPPPRQRQRQRRCECGRPLQPWLEPAVAHASEYCSSTSMHGLQYVGDRDRPLAERLLWLLLFCTSLTVCGYLIRNIWIKWEQTPVIVTFGETSTPVWEVPFPAVTICSQTKTDTSLFNYSDAFFRQDNLTDDEWRRFADLSLLCASSDTPVRGPNFTDHTSIQFLKQVAPRINESILIFLWQNHEVTSMEALRPVMTENGLCYSFNMLNDDQIYSDEVLKEMKRIDDQLDTPRREPDWNFDGGFKPGAGLKTYPARALGSGQFSQMYILLSTLKSSLDYVCTGPIQGYTVSLHNPAEVPGMANNDIRLPLATETTVVVRPNVLTTSESLRGYSPARKQCYFPYERRLRFFRVYTQGNCEMECHANRTLKHCSCVPFFMPHTEETPICGIGSSACLENLTDEVMRLMVTSYGKKHQEGATPILDYSGCECLPSCTTLEFDTEISQADFDLRTYLRASKLNFSDIVGIEVSAISVYFKESHFISKRRTELYGVTDFIANSGGLLGLFMGFSLLSLVEIFYFFSCRIGFTLSMKKTPTSNTAKRDYSPVSSL